MKKILVKCMKMCMVILLTIVANQQGELVPDRTAVIKKLTDAVGELNDAEITVIGAEMMVEHTDGTVEYVKDIDNIMLLADKDYHITYTGEF